MAHALRNDTCWLVAFFVCTILASGCRSAEAPPPPSHPIIIVGIDGGEWSVIEDLWSEGRLPAMRALSEAGITAKLQTDYQASPVIWTTMATGVVPDRHGIKSFFTTQEDRQVPVSSTVRRVAALWNIASKTGRSVAVLGWWATWPAEAVNGIVVSDRVFRKLPKRTYPESLAVELESLLENTPAQENPFQGSQFARRRDHLMASLAERYASSHDLTLVYFRGVDQVSHWYWKYMEPEAFDKVDEGMAEELGGIIPVAYEAVDAAIGRLMEAVGRRANIFVLSDHGFEAAAREQIKIQLDLNLVLEQLGFLSRRPDGSIDLSNSLVHNGPPDRSTHKALHFSPSNRHSGAAERARIKGEVLRALERVRYLTGKQALRGVDSVPPHSKVKGDFFVKVLTNGATPELVIDGQELEGAIPSIEHVSGVHWRNPPGIFIAAGPDIDPTAEISGIDIHDIAPTILYALGLPVARDFDGQPWRTLFTTEFRRIHPLRTVSTWGASEGNQVSESEVDAELMDELRALGYIP